MMNGDNFSDKNHLLWRIFPILYSENLHEF